MNAGWSRYTTLAARFQANSLRRRPLRSTYAFGNQGPCSRMKPPPDEAHPGPPCKGTPPRHLNLVCNSSSQQVCVHAAVPQQGCATSLAS